MFRGAAVITALSTTTGIVSLLSQLVLAELFGAGSELDAYLIGASVPTVLSGLGATLLSYWAVPELVRRASDPQAFRSFSRSLFQRLCTVVFVVTGFGIALAQPTVSLFGAPLPPELQRDAVLMMRISWVSGAFLVMASYVGCVLTALRSFYLPTIMVSLPYLGILASAYLLSPHIGVVSVPAGLLGGALLSCAVLIVLAGPNLWGTAHADSGEGLRVFWKGIPHAAAAMSCFTFYAASDAFWAPMVGTGNLSLLGYGHRILIGVGNLVVAGPAVMLIPFLADAGKEGGDDAVQSRLLRITTATVVSAAGIAAVLAFLAEPVIALLFQRGLFDAAATAGLAGVLTIMLAGMVPMLGTTVLFRGLFQLRAGRTAGMLGLGWCLLYFTASGVLGNVFGVSGIAWAYVLAWVCTFSVAYTLIVRRGTQRERWRTSLGVALACTLSLAAVAIVLPSVRHLTDALRDSGGIWRLASLAVDAACGLAAYAATYLLVMRVRLHHPLSGMS